MLLVKRCVFSLHFEDIRWLRCSDSQGKLIRLPRRALSFLYLEEWWAESCHAIETHREMVRWWCSAGCDECLWLCMQVLLLWIWWGHLEESSGGTQQWGDIGELWEVGQLHSGSVWWHAGKDLPQAICSRPISRWEGTEQTPDIPDAVKEKPGWRGQLFKIWKRF